MRLITARCAGVKEVLLKDEAEHLKVVATGLKILERQEMKAPAVWPTNKGGYTNVLGLSAF